jgi:hypothetical protein
MSDYCADCGTTTGDHKESCPEYAALKHDIDRIYEINTELLYENEVLREQNFDMNKTIVNVRIDMKIGELVRSKLVSGNGIPIERCVIRADEVEAIRASIAEPV